MAGGTIDLKRLTTEELSGVVSIYPWFGAARKELCERMAAVGGAEDRGGRLFAESALYLPCRKRLAEILETSAVREYADADVKALIEAQLKSRLESGSASRFDSGLGFIPDSGSDFPQASQGGSGSAGKQESANGESDGEPGAGYRREVHIVGGDYFSAADYDGVRGADDNFFRQVAKDSTEGSRAKDDRAVPHLGFYTQTLAEIYAEQGYFDEAKQIYSQLILAYPEKSAYFASLIEKLG